MCHFSLELEVLILQQNGPDSPQSHKSSATPIVSPSSPNTGLTFIESTISEISPTGTMAQLPLFPADSPVSLSVQLGSEEAEAMTATSGRRCLESFKCLVPGSSWQRTFLASLLSSPAWHSRLCLLIWRLRDTKRGRVLFLLRASVPRTSDTGYSLWPTPDANSGERYGQNPQRVNPERTYTINDAVRMWPTPTENGNYNRKGASASSGDGLATAIGGQLNPTWVEWLQGFPLGWTALEPSAMPSSRSKSTRSCKR